MQADGRLEVIVGHLVDVLAPNGRRAPAVSRRSRDHPGRGAADGRVLLAEGAAEGEECSGAAAVVMPVGALAGHPGEQPRLDAGSDASRA